MKIDFPALLRHRPFQITWIWETLCIVAAAVLLLHGYGELLSIGVIFAGVAPMVVVVLRFSQRPPIVSTGRSEDIVQ